LYLTTEEQVFRDASIVEASIDGHSPALSQTPKQLADIVSRFAATGGWLDRVRLRNGSRWYERMHLGPDYDIWAISWMPGQSTGFHDHGNSSGAFVVITGALEEYRPGEPAVMIPPNTPRAFGPDYAHDVRNTSTAPAISIHAYSPPLSEMNEYELDGDELILRGQALERVGTTHAGPPTIEQTLAAARSRLRRLSPLDAFDAVARKGAVLVDIRPERQRSLEGTIPGALIIERNVLEWRFDPSSSARLPIATDHDLQVIVICSEGYTSSLAAVALKELGLRRATDVEGGFQGWRLAGLPTESQVISS
jgi:rhodanese-related sulfurtransferase/mannose-6-phosphate isomerase-like protein (cupin superfamily)